MDIGKEGKPYIAEPIRDPFRRDTPEPLREAPPLPEPAPLPEPDPVKAPEKVPA